MPATEDMRMHKAFDVWCEHRNEEHPEWRRGNPTDPMRPFFDGWQARFDAATVAFSTEGDVGLIQDQLNLLERQYDRAWGEYFKAHKKIAMYQRLLESQREMIRNRGGDPIEAPAWRRISEQRKELRSLHRENLRLKGAIADLESAAVGFPKEVKDND